MGLRRPLLRGPVHPTSVLEQVHDGPLCSSAFDRPRSLDNVVAHFLVLRDGKHKLCLGGRTFRAMAIQCKEDTGGQSAVEEEEEEEEEKGKEKEKGTSKNKNEEIKIKTSGGRDGWGAKWAV